MGVRGGSDHQAYSILESMEVTCPVETVDQTRVRVLSWNTDHKVCQSVELRAVALERRNLNVGECFRVEVS